MLTILWHLMCHCLTAFSVRNAREDWNTWIQETNTFDKYKKVVMALFADGIVTNGRLLVLHIFTLDVGNIHPHIADNVHEFENLISSRYQ